VDRIAPLVTITAPISGAYIKTQTSTVNWIVSEMGSGLAKTELSSDGSNWTVQLGNSASITVPEGHHEVHVRATDIAGNVMTATVNFTIDLTAPTVLAASPSDGNQSMLATIEVTFSESMNKVSTSVDLNNLMGSISWNGNNLTFTPSEALKGRTVYSVTAYGLDLAGNSVIFSWSFSTATVGKISGILLGHDGNPLANTVVKLIPQGPSARTEMNHLALIVSGLGTERNTTTDANGAYAFYDVAIGNYTLEFTENGYLTETTAVVMTSEAVDSGGLKIDPGAAVYNPNNGLMLNVAVLSISAAMAGIFLFMRRRKRLSVTVDTGPKKTKMDVQAAKPEGKAPQEESAEPQAMQKEQVDNKEKSPDLLTRKGTKGKK
jgi:hypothetical protein